MKMNDKWDALSDPNDLEPLIEAATSGLSVVEAPGVENQLSRIGVGASSFVDLSLLPSENTQLTSMPHAVM